jgi:DNA primase
VASDFTQSVKEQADIVRVIGEYVRLKKAGAQNWLGLCPFHKEKTPSFSVHQTRQFFHCFGCGKSGDVFTFVKEIEHVTFPEAVRTVAQKMGIALPKQQFASPQEAEEARQRGVMLEIHDRAAEWFQQQLASAEGAKAREYLLQQRGLDERVIKAFRIGYAPDDFNALKDHLKRNYSEDQLKLTGILKESQNGGSTYAAFRNRVMFPITNEAGRIIAFTGRTLAAPGDEKAGPKYLNSPETPIYTKGRVLFNLDKAKEAIRKLDYVIVVEGNVDCITVFASGFQNVIATSGTAFTEVQVRLLARFTKNIVVNFDPDNAGANATEKSLALLLEEDFNVRVLSLEAGFDPDLYIRRKGKQAYAEALKSSLPYTEYLIERARALFPPRSPDAKVKAVNWLLPHIQRIPSRIKRDELAMDAAQKLGIDSNTLRQELKQAAVARTSKQIRATDAGTITDAERVLLRALAPGAPAEFAETQHHLREAIAGERLHEGLGAEAVFAVLLEHASAQSVTDLPLDEAGQRLTARVLMEEIAWEQEFDVELLQHAIAALRRMHLERQQRRLAAELASAERQNDVTRVAQLLQQKMQLVQALREL